MRDRLLCSCLLLACGAAAAVAQQQRVPNNNDPKATVVDDTPLYGSADTTSTQLAEIKAGREMVIIGHNGPWLQVFANTDVQTSHDPNVPVFGSAQATPISGWIEAKTVVSATTPKGDLILFGVAANDEVQASQPHAPSGAAQAAELLYQRTAELFPQSPLAPEAAWRSADIAWQLQKADVFSLPSAHEKQAYLREQIDETGMRKIEKMYPRSKWSDLAAWDMLDNKICGDWQGSTECPEKEADMYEKYAEEHPDSTKAPEALYEAAYRQCVLSDMYTGNGDDKKAQQAKARAVAIADTIESKYAESDYAARTAGLIYKLQASIPIYGASPQ
jgi:hypothetical protein